MLIEIEPLKKSLDSIEKKGHVVNLSPQGKLFNQNKAIEFASLKNINLICGRYEGIDQRFIDNYVDEELSIGDYILSGGEIAASVVIDSILRNIPGVIGNEDSVAKDSHSSGRLKGHSYTKPSDFNGLKVPKILLSGDHKKIEEWKIANSLWVTKQKRPDLFKQIQLSEKEVILLRDYEYQLKQNEQ
jgi:tRNA (guanine37-N1)-methyltransferase